MKAIPSLTSLPLEGPLQPENQGAIRAHLFSGETNAEQRAAMTTPSYLPLIQQTIPQQAIGAVSLFQSQSSWIWTPELLLPGNAIPDAPVNEQRAFRKTFVNSNPTKTPSNATIVIAVDNYFAMYVDGLLVQAADPTNNWANVLAFTVAIQGNKTVLAIRAVNTAVNTVDFEGPAGLRAAVSISFSDGSTQTFYTGMDQTWLGEAIFPEGWEQPDFDDADWNPAVVYPDSVKNTTWTPLNLPTKLFVGSTPTQPAPTPTSSGSLGQNKADLTNGNSLTFSPGALAGMLVGVVAFVAIVVALITYFLTKRKFKDCVEHRDHLQYKLQSQDGMDVVEHPVI